VKLEHTSIASGIGAYVDLLNQLAIVHNVPTALYAGNAPPRLAWLYLHSSGWLVLALRLTGSVTDYGLPYDGLPPVAQQFLRGFNFVRGLDHLSFLSQVEAESLLQVWARLGTAAVLWAHSPLGMEGFFAYNQALLLEVDATISRLGRPNSPALKAFMEKSEQQHRFQKHGFNATRSMLGLPERDSAEDLELMQPLIQRLAATPAAGDGSAGILISATAAAAAPAGRTDRRRKFHTHRRRAKPRKEAKRDQPVSDGRRRAKASGMSKTASKKKKKS
jgi:hypothetical protein